jgi:hypothetical protein
LSSAGFSADRTRQLAGRLAERNLYDRAAQVWKDYLVTAKISDNERAKILFQIGILLEKSGVYSEAIESFYRSESAAKVEDLQSQINSHIKDCFESLGKFSALRYELMERTGFGKSKTSAGKVVAEIGPEKITEASHDAQIEETVDNQISTLLMFMTPEQVKEQKKRLLEQYKSPQVRQQFLQRWIGEEVLYRQSLEMNLSQKPEIQGILREIDRGVFSQQLLNQQQAVDVIKRIKAGEDFSELAKQLSKDQATKQKGGKIDVEVTEGSYVLSIGEAKELKEKIFATPAIVDNKLYVRNDKHMYTFGR